MKRLTCASVMKLEPPDVPDELELAPPPPRPPVTLAPSEPVDDDDEEEDADDEPPLAVWPTEPLTAVTVPRHGGAQGRGCDGLLGALDGQLRAVDVGLGRWPRSSARRASRRARPGARAFRPARLRGGGRRSLGLTSASWADCGSASAWARSTLRGRIDLGQDVVLGDVLALLDVDVGDLAAGGEVDVGLVGGLEVAGAGDVDWITLRSTVAVRSWALEAAGEPTTRRDDDGGGGERRQRQSGEGGRRATSARAVASALAAPRRLPVRRAPTEGHAALECRAQLLKLRRVRRRFGVPEARWRLPRPARRAARRCRRADGWGPSTPPSSGTPRPSGPAEAARLPRRCRARPGAGVAGGARARAAARGEAEGDEKGADGGARWPRGAHKQAMNQPPLIGVEEARASVLRRELRLAQLACHQRGEGQELSTVEHLEHVPDRIGPLALAQARRARPWRWPSPVAAHAPRVGCPT